MLERLSIPGIPLPRLYVAHTKKDADDAMAAGIPFVRWKDSNETLVKVLLRPVLAKLFPYIKWDKQLKGLRKFSSRIIDVEGTKELNPEVEAASRVEIGEEAYWESEKDTMSEMVDIAKDERICDGSGSEAIGHRLPLEEYIGDLSSSVNLEVLQSLKLMPAFIGDITDCIKINLSECLYWTEGYNKKRRAPLGNFNASGQLPNLMILDVSGSIPRGISATMIQLIDTLRTETHSDLIITSSMSRFYPHGSELPDPQEIRNKFGCANETEDFARILKDHVVGHKWGHVISFGDDDTPSYDRMLRSGSGHVNFEGTSVGEVHHYHTGRWGEGSTGYAKWCDRYVYPEPKISYDTSWCKIISDYEYC